MSSTSDRRPRAQSAQSAFPSKRVTAGIFELLRVCQVVGAQKIHGSPTLRSRSGVPTTEQVGGRRAVVDLEGVGLRCDMGLPPNESTDNCGAGGLASQATHSEGPPCASSYQSPAPWRL